MLIYKKCVIASDHGGFDLKNNLVSFLKDFPGLEIIDLGTNTAESVDYPVYAKKLVQEIISERAECGILVCGTGIGMSIMANRFKGIRAALVYDKFTAQMSREHNNANVLCLGGRILTPENAQDIVSLWLTTPFSGGRHQKRVDFFD